MRLLEIHIEVKDIERALAFYAALLPHHKIVHWQDGSAKALVLHDGTAFGIWKIGKLGLLNGRGGEHLHFAFQIKPEDYNHYKQKLIELKVTPLEHIWDDGHRSLYFFDADNHQGEFMTRDWLWKERAEAKPQTE